MQNSSPFKPNKFILKEGSNQKISQNFSQPQQQKPNLQRVQIKSNLIRNQFANNQKPIIQNQIENFSKANQKQEFLLPHQLQQQQVTNDNNDQQQYNFNYYNNQKFQNEQEQQRLIRVSSQPPNPKIKIIQQILNGDSNQIRNQNTNSQNHYSYYQKQNLSKANQKQEFSLPQELYWQQISNDKIQQQQNIYQDNNQNFENDQGQQRQIRVSSQPINLKIKIINQIQNGELIQYNGQKIGNNHRLDDEQQKFLQKSIKGNVKVSSVSQKLPFKPGSPLKQQIKQQSPSKKVRQQTPIQQENDESFESVMRTQYFNCIHCHQQIQSNSFNLLCQHSYHVSCFTEFIQFQIQQKDRIKLQCHCNHYISLKVIRQISLQLVDLWLQKLLQIIKRNYPQKILKCNSCDFFCFSKNIQINLSCPYCQDKIQFPTIIIK